MRKHDLTNKKTAADKKKDKDKIHWAAFKILVMFQKVFAFFPKFIVKNTKNMQ